MTPSNALLTAVANRLQWFVVVVSLYGCGGVTPAPAPQGAGGGVSTAAGGAATAGGGADAGRTDAGSFDAGSLDAGNFDAGSLDAGGAVTIPTIDYNESTARSVLLFARVQPSPARITLYWANIAGQVVYSHTVFRKLNPDDSSLRG
jgi:hypothetical protein